MRINIKSKLWWKICKWHWIVNPGLGFNEVILGTRIPKDIYLDTGLGTSLKDQQLIICNECKHEMPYKFMSKTIGLGLWFGLYCSNCKSEIPCLKNIVSMTFYIIAYPIWYPIWLLIKDRYIAYVIKRITAQQKDVCMSNQLSASEIANNQQ